jgi:dTDP-4-dehydrorhamnose 3,5-epimerase-like enzyme
MDKVRVENLPEGKAFDGPKRWSEDRGEFAQVSAGEAIRHLACFEIRKGFSRGGHYHSRKEEVFYVVDGTLRGVFRDMDTGVTEASVFTKGKKIRVRTQCGHIFYGIDDALVIEYSPQDYDKDDAYPVDFSG